MTNFRLQAAFTALLLATGVSHAATATITARRAQNAERSSEVIVVPFVEIARVLPDARMFHLRLKDSSGKELPLQVTNYEHDHRGIHYDDLVFQYDFKRNEYQAHLCVRRLDQQARDLLIVEADANRFHVAAFGSGYCDTETLIGSFTRVTKSATYRSQSSRDLNWPLPSHPAPRK